jgi:hypothetical protein
MASSPQLPPPPGQDSGASPAASPSPTPQPASPAPAQPSPQMQQGTQLAIGVVNQLRAIAKAFPKTAPKVAEVNNLMREITAVMMESQQTPEPAAPPNGA